MVSSYLKSGIFAEPGFDVVEEIKDAAADLEVPRAVSLGSQVRQDALGDSVDVGDFNWPCGFALHKTQPLVIHSR